MNDFARQFFSAFGARFRENRRGLKVALSGALAQHFGREHLDLVFDAAHRQPGQDLLTPGSRTFDLMVDYVRARGTRAVQELPATYADTSAAVPELRLSNCRVARRSRRKAQGLVGIFSFKIAYTCDERVEELFTVAVDAEGRLRPDLPDRLGEAQPATGKAPSAGPRLERMFRAAEEHAAAHADERAAEREGEILARLHREVSRLVAYYEQLIEELPLGPVEGASAEAQLRAELERKAGEEIEAHRLHVAIAPINCCLVAVPEARYRLRLAAGEVETTLELRRDLHTGALDLPRCPCCQGETAEVGLCRSGHIACPECLSRCGVCGCDVCAACGAQPCVVCGRPLCATCKATCPQCQGRTCPEHVSACPTCGAEVCAQCQAECAGCGTQQCAGHLRACVECEDLFCANCTAACARCGTPVCGEHAVTCGTCGGVCCPQCASRCATCDQALCPTHALTCRECGNVVCSEHGGACAGCGDAVCAEHAGTCEECGKPVCRECMVACTVCGAVRCHPHRAVCRVCGRAVCREHSQVCAACGHLVCAEHAGECAGCGRRACANHLDTCSICDQPYCDLCRHVEAKCVFCAGLQHAEGVPDERVRAIPGLPRRLRSYTGWRLVENAGCRIYLGERGLGLAVVVTDKQDSLLKAEELGWLSSLLGI